MTSDSEFNTIRHYCDSEIEAAIERLCKSEEFLTLFTHLTKMDRATIQGALQGIRSRAEFQAKFFGPAIQSLINTTTDGITVSGMELVDKNTSYIFREYKKDKEAQEKYLDFLRDLLKDKACIYLSYMTGILPIKKYGTHSALNMFDEFSMIDPGPLACYVGFTEQEVKKLCEQYRMDMEEVKNWYDGYSFDGVPSVYSPRSVVNSMRFQKISNYWNQTETFEALQMYIDMNFEHLKDDVLSMIAGESVAVNTESFTNDMATFRTEDDVLTLLIHLGYLAYDDKTKTVKIPNSEIRAEYVNTVSVSDW